VVGFFGISVTAGLGKAPTLRSAFEAGARAIPADNSAIQQRKGWGKQP
jgi:hypothetical protein